MELEEVLLKSGYKKEDIKSKQLIAVYTLSNTAIVYLYENGKLIKTINEAYIGKNGITKNKMEGDMKTPFGLYKIGIAFGIKDMSGYIKYPYKTITDNSYWVDDIKSKNYNKWIEVEKEKDIDWNSAEHLIKFPVQYKYGLVIEYNTSGQYNEKDNIGNNLGSAIFMHVNKMNYTAGCVAVSEEDMKYVLNWIKDAEILIF